MTSSGQAARRSGCRDRLAEREIAVRVRGREVERDVGTGLGEGPRARHQPEAREARRRVHVEAVGDALDQVVAGGITAPRRRRSSSGSARRRAQPDAVRAALEEPHAEQPSSRATWWLIAEALKCSSVAACAKLRRRDGLECAQVGERGKVAIRLTRLLDDEPSSRLMRLRLSSCDSESMMTPFNGSAAAAAAANRASGQRETTMIEPRRSDRTERPVPAR